MQVYTDLLPATKSDPKGRAAFDWTADEFADPLNPLPSAGVLTVKNSRGHASYAVTEFPTGWDGRGFFLKKLTAGTDPEADSYSVFVGKNGQDKRCECKGFEATGSCKHLLALVALIETGKL